MIIKRSLIRRKIVLHFLVNRPNNSLCNIVMMKKKKKMPIMLVKVSDPIPFISINVRLTEEQENEVMDYQVFFFHLFSVQNPIHGSSFCQIPDHLLLVVDELIEKKRKIIEVLITLYI